MSAAEVRPQQILKHREKLDSSPECTISLKFGVLKHQAFWEQLLVKFCKRTITILVLLQLLEG